MDTEKYLLLKSEVIEAGYEKEVIWAETVAAPKSALAFFLEYAWVVINSGMKNQVAQGIWHRVYGALIKGWQVAAVFKHPGKAKAIQWVWENKEKLFKNYKGQPKHLILDWLQGLPWIGPITKFHLAKNIGFDVCKPDRHLVRVAAQYGKTPVALCSALAKETGDRIGTVDYVLWRAANLGKI